MNLKEMIFAVFVLLSATLNLSFFIGDLSDPAIHSVYQLFAVVVINFLATAMKLGDHTHVGAFHLAALLVADLQLVVAIVWWAYATNISSEGLSGPATAVVVSLSGGAALANLVSVILLVVDSVSSQRR